MSTLGAKLKSIFTQFDSNKEHVIPREKLLNILQQLDPTWTPDELALLFEIADKDGNGVIDYNEFIDFVCYMDEDPNAKPAPVEEEPAPVEEAKVMNEEKALPDGSTPPTDSVVEEAPSTKPKRRATLPSHSAIRWGKPLTEIETVVGDDVECQDEGNGNRPIHLAAQNGHFEIVQWLISKKCNVDAQNKKGATALHMAVAYDAYFVVEALLAANADTTIKNEAGNDSITGLDGDHTGSNAWDGGFNMFLSANTAAMAEAALAKLEANPEGVDKAKFAQVGMKKKKAIPDFPKEKFFAFMQSL